MVMVVVVVVVGGVERGVTDDMLQSVSPTKVLPSLHCALPSSGRRLTAL